MTIEGIDVEAFLARAKAQLLQEPDLSPAFKSTIELLLLLIGLLLNRHGLNSKNSSKPPSTDPNRKKGSRKGTATRKPGGQPGRQGTTLMPVDDPDEIAELHVDRRTLAKGPTYRPVGVEKRQVIDLYITRRITEFQAEVLEDSNGKRWAAGKRSNEDVILSGSRAG